MEHPVSDARLSYLRGLSVPETVKVAALLHRLRPGERYLYQCQAREDGFETWAVSASTDDACEGPPGLGTRPLESFTHAVFRTFAGATSADLLLTAHCLVSAFEAARGGAAKAQVFGAVAGRRAGNVAAALAHEFECRGENVVAVTADGAVLAWDTDGETRCLVVHEPGRFTARHVWTPRPRD